MSSTPTPSWIRNLRDLDKSVREVRISRWLRSVARSSRASAPDDFKQRLNHQLELLRDTIAEARRAGLSWAAIGSMLGLTPDTVQSIYVD